MDFPAALWPLHTFNDGNKYPPIAISIALFPVSTLSSLDISVVSISDISITPSSGTFLALSINNFTISGPNSTNSSLASFNSCSTIENLYLSSENLFKSSFCILYPASSLSMYNTHSLIFCISSQHKSIHLKLLHPIGTDTTLSNPAWITLKASIIPSVKITGLE